MQDSMRISTGAYTLLCIINQCCHRSLNSEPPRNPKYPFKINTLDTLDMQWYRNKRLKKIRRKDPKIPRTIVHINMYDFYILSRVFKRKPIFICVGTLVNNADRTPLHLFLNQRCYFCCWNSICKGK